MDAVRAMLARPDYLIPLAAAERQFRDHYYGLNSAALLEDLFFDALGNFMRQTRPRVSFERPPTGQKGWDYEFNGLHISHKVSQNLGDIAALWDATKKGVSTWTFDEPIVYVLGQNAPSTSLAVEIPGGGSVRCRSVADLGRPYELKGRTLLVVRWPSDGGQPQLLGVIQSIQDQTAETVLPFSAAWQYVSDQVGGGHPANEIDVFVTTSKTALAGVKASPESPIPIDICVGRRGGVYMLSRDLLTDLRVKTNNRAILIPKAVVADLLEEAELRGLFSPLPLWYWPYAEARPPDMYSAQRAEYEARFSARGAFDT